MNNVEHWSQERKKNYAGITTLCNVVVLYIVINKINDNNTNSHR